ncbi:hypothetical protein BDV18DRAFT_64528 [Aspergillus unguis]
MSQAAISWSDDELQLSEDRDYTPSPSPSLKGKYTKQGSLDPAYTTTEEEPDSPETNVGTGPAAVKRKYEVPTAEDEVPLLENNPFSPPSAKKAYFATESSENTSAEPARPVKTAKSVIATAAQKKAIKNFTGYSTDSSDDSSQQPVGGRRRSAVYDDDKNYVAESDDDDRYLDEEYDIPADERANVVFDFNRERDRRWADVLNIPEDRYSEKERDIFTQLAMRGFEPLAPKHWQFDFPTLPDSLFPEDGLEKNEPIISLTRSTAFYAIKSLGNLFSLSGRVRDCSIVGKRPENLIKQTIKKYIRWALFDVNLDISRGSLPLHVIHAQRKQETVRDALERLNRRLKKLALRHRNALESIPSRASTMIGAFEDSNSTAEYNKFKAEIPLLIGFLICGPVLALMTFDLGLVGDNDDIDEIDGKFFTQCDFSERGQDVWNSLSLAIVVMHIRNTMVGLSKHGYGGFVKAKKTGAASDDL